MSLRVIKLGGSLLTLSDWHERFTRWLAAEPPAVNLLLIGGGELVDLLRREYERFSYTEKQMHVAALAAMEINAQLAQVRLQHAKILQSSLELQTLLPPVIDRGLIEESPIYLVAINRWWLAAAAAGELLPPETWATTSDALAAWIARKIEAQELVLLKSSEPPSPLAEWAAHGYVDPHFTEWLGAVTCRAVNLRANQLI